MTKGRTDSIRYYYATVRKGLAYLSEVKARPTRSPSLEMMKECALEQGIEVEDFVDGTYLYRKGNATKIVGASLDHGATIWLCSNKYATYEFLKKYGFEQFPRYQRYSLETINEARQDFKQRNRPVVVKPSRQTFGGTGVTVNIMSMRELNKAIFNSLVYDSNFMLEDYIEGDNFRVLMYKDKMLNALYRLPANVTGDGKSTIKQLIDTENEKRAQDRSFSPLFQIVIDNDVRQTLLNKKLSLSHVPAEGEIVYVRTISNHHAGGVTRDVTSSVHPDVVRVCQNIMKVMNVTSGGIDIITKDITKPLAESGGMINEVNTSPGLDLHGRATVMQLVDCLFGEGDLPESQEPASSTVVIDSLSARPSVVGGR